MANQTKKTNPQKLTINVEVRDIFGKKIRRLRQQNLIPANIFGSDFKSKSITVNAIDFKKIYKIAKETGVIYLKLDKEDIPVLIHQVQRHPITDNILHIDFRKVDLAKKITTEVPIKIINQSEAVTQKGGVLLTLSETLLIEALPENIPQAIEVDISKITEIGQEIKVADLAKSEKYELKTPPDKVVVSVIAHKEESVTPETATTAPEVITEKTKEEETPPSPQSTTSSQEIKTENK